jgi:8-oxo-dGTP diphosphatase
MIPSRKKEYINPGVTVDVVIFTIENDLLKIVLIHRAHNPFKNSPALPGGFLHTDESSRKTAERILADKAGVKNVYIEQLYTFDEPTRDPRGHIISITYFALVPREQLDIQENTQTEHPELVPLNSLPPLAFDHTEIVAYALQRLQDKIVYTNIIYSLLPVLFTFSQVQKMYEIILAKKIDKRNFRKKFLHLGLIEATRNKSKGGRQRPALLYRFKKTAPAELKKFF